MSDKIKLRTPIPKLNQDSRGYWRVSFYRDGKRKYEYFGKGARGRELAQKFLADKTQDLYRQDLGLLKEISAEDFFAEYLIYSVANKAKKSAQRDKLAISHLLPYLENKKLAEIVPQLIEKYKSDRKKKVKPSTVNRELNTILAAFNKAVEWGYLYHNPISSVKKFKEPKVKPTNKGLMQKIKEKEPEVPTEDKQVDKRKEGKSIGFFPAPEGTKWSQTKFVATGSVKIKIFIKGRAKEFDQKELKQEGLPNPLFSLLFRIITFNGLYDKDKINYKEIRNLKSNISKLRKFLREKFGINDDPIKSDRNGIYSVQFLVKSEFDQSSPDENSSLFEDCLPKVKVTHLDPHQ